ncbi:MAG: DUF4810 domain-containing protein [Flavobacteriaceae bacterium]
MKNRILILGMALTLLYSCSSTKKLYSFPSDYESAYYKHLKGNSDSYARVLQEMFRDIRNQENAKIPPGLYAEYGFILLAQGHKNRAQIYFDKEIQEYPENSYFIHLKLQQHEAR